MKKFAFLFIMAVAAFSIQAKDILPEHVPANVRAYFNKHYPNARDVEWNMKDRGAYYKVEFEINGEDGKLKITSDGKAFYVKEPISIKEVPSSITRYIKDNYDSADILKAKRKIEHGQTKYDIYVVFRSERGYTRHRNLIFDSKGNIIKG
jgi:hypothetical protein